MEDSPERARCCKLCSFRCSKNYLLLKHLFEAHSGTEGFSIDCPIDGCCHTFTQGSCFSSILSHANRKHQNWRDRFEQQRTVELSINNERNDKTQPSAETDITEEQLDNANDAYIPGIAEYRDTFVPPNDSRASAGKFLLTLKERHRLSQTAISFTIESVRKLITHVSGEIKASASAAGVNISSEALDPFRGLDTEYLQTKFYQEHFGLVVSMICSNLCC